MNEYADFFSGKMEWWALPVLNPAFLFHVSALDCDGAILNAHVSTSICPNGDVMPSRFVRRMRGHDRKTFFVPQEDHFIVAMGALMTEATLDHCSLGRNRADVKLTFQVSNVFSFHFTTRFDRGNPLTRTPDSVRNASKVTGPNIPSIWPLYKAAWDLKPLLDAFGNPRKTGDSAGYTSYDLLDARRD